VFGRPQSVEEVWMLLEGRNAVIYGGGGSIGRAMAVAAPPAGFEPATHGLGNRRSIP
jgi:NAD(P)-dependent dehydrogenase (short-subunit alcohol dehydrogenase family)